MSAHPTLSITVLSDNRAAYGLEAEHGFALWIQAGGQHILFDTGRGEAMLKNAAALGIDLRLTDSVVLSHGHYDHTGSVSAVLDAAPQAHLYLHQDALRERYSIHEAPKLIGMPEPSLATIRDLVDARCSWISTSCAIADGVILSGPVPRKTAYEDTGGPFFLDVAGTCADPIADDLSLWIETPAGLVVCLGCCHAGIINTLQHCLGLTGEHRVLAVIGGMHLVQATTTRLEQTAEVLKEYTIPHVFPCHCTGDTACAYLAERLGSSVQQGYAGLKISF
jgi:7,8-dihydropterin-6-yl-methyl-4-(beta-D-ribofuranosyl)aminobenzene 5'-phosphate synthase